MTKCAWTGQPFKASGRGKHPQKFASASARNQAHTAARQYTEHLIACGFLTWEMLKQWHDAHNPASVKACTSQQVTISATPQEIPPLPVAAQ